MTRLLKKTSLILLAMIAVVCAGLALAFSVRTVSAATDTVAQQSEFYMDGVQVRLPGIGETEDVNGIRFSATITEDYVKTLKADSANDKLTYYVVIGLASKVPGSDISGLTLENSQQIKQIVLVSPKEEEAFTDGKYTFSGSLNFSEISEGLERTAYDSDFVARAVVTYKDRTAGTKTIYSYQASFEEAAISMSEVAKKYLLAQAEENITTGLDTVAHYIETATEVSAFTEEGSSEIKFIDNPGFERATVYEYFADEWGEGAVKTLGTIRGTSFTCCDVAEMEVDEVKNILILDKDGNFYKAECKKVTKIIETREDFIEIFARPRFYFYGTMAYKNTETGEVTSINFDTRNAEEENVTWFKDGIYLRSRAAAYHNADGSVIDGYERLTDTSRNMSKYSITGSYVLANDIELGADITTYTYQGVKYVKELIPDMYGYAIYDVPAFWGDKTYRTNGQEGYALMNTYSASSGTDTFDLDGLGHTISNVTRIKKTFSQNNDGTIKSVNYGVVDQGGLFNSLKDCTIKNLGVIAAEDNNNYKVGSTLVLGDDGKITYNENADGAVLSAPVAQVVTTFAYEITNSTIDNVYVYSPNVDTNRGSAFALGVAGSTKVTNSVIVAGEQTTHIDGFGYGALGATAYGIAHSLYDNVIVITPYKALAYSKTTVWVASNDAEDTDITIGGTAMTVDTSKIYNGVTRYDDVLALQSAASANPDLYSAFSDLVWSKLEDNTINWSALEAATATVSCGTNVALTAKTGDVTVDSGIHYNERAIISTSKGVKAIVSAISDNESIATVTKEGYIEAVGKGETFITLGYRIGGKTYGVTINVAVQGYNKDLGTKNYSCYDGLTAEDQELFNGNVTKVYAYDKTTLLKGEEIAYNDGKLAITNTDSKVKEISLYIETDATSGVNEYILTLNAYTRILYDVEDFVEFFGPISKKELYDNSKIVAVKTAEGSTETKNVCVVPIQVVTGCFALANDIDMKGTKLPLSVSFNGAYDQGENGDGRFTAAGLTGTYAWYLAQRYFVNATFDGLGHTVSNLDLAEGTTGLFGNMRFTKEEYAVNGLLINAARYSNADETAATSLPSDFDQGNTFEAEPTLVKNIAFTNVTYTGTGNRALLANQTGYHAGFENVYVQISGTVVDRQGALTFSSNVGLYKNVVVEYPEGPEIVAGGDMYGYGPMVVDGANGVYFVHTNGTAGNYSMNYRTYMENVIFITKTPTLGGYYKGNRVYIAQNETLVNGEPSDDLTCGGGGADVFTNAGYTYGGSNETVAAMTNKLYIRGTYRYDDYAEAIADGKTQIGSMTITENGVVWNYAD